MPFDDTSTRELALLLKIRLALSTSEWLVDGYWEGGTKYQPDSVCLLGAFNIADHRHAEWWGDRPGAYYTVASHRILNTMAREVAPVRYFFIRPSRRYRLIEKFNDVTAESFDDVVNLLDRVETRLRAA